MIDIAYAQTGGQGLGDSAVLMNIVMLAAIFGVFYFLLIRPQQKKAKDHKTMLDNLKKGDTVITQGGIYGKIAAINDQEITLEIAEKVRVRVARGSIAGLGQSSSSPPATNP
jgi:preprotein translocase subunit YajC